MLITNCPVDVKSETGKTSYGTVRVNLDFVPFSCGLCGLMVERSIAIQKVAGSNLGRSASRQQPWASYSHACACHQAV